MRRAVAAVFLFSGIFLINFTARVWAGPDVYVNNKMIGTAISKNGSSYIPVEKLTKALNAEVGVNQDSTIKVNGRKLQARAIKTKEGWLVPVRPVAASLGYRFEYNRATGIIDLFRSESTQGGDPENNDAPGNQALNVRHINFKSPGEKIDIAKYVMKGKWNIFCFYSNYCGACRRAVPLVEKLARMRSDMVLNEVDINRPGVEEIDFSSPVSRQYDLEYTPFFVIYNEFGAQVATDKPAYHMVIKMLDENNVR